jgi:Flp pilus assembly protein TadD
MRLIATAVTLSLGFAAGCASDSTFDLSRDTSSRSSAGGDRSIWGSGDRSVAASTPSSSASPTASVSRVFRQVSTSVSNAFDRESPTASATDPSQLSSRPESLSPSLYVRAAAWSEDQGAISKAQQQYAKALELDPKNVKTLVAFARFHDRQGHDNEALQLYRQAHDLAPNDVVVLNDVGLFQARRRNFAPALEALQQAVQSQPRNIRYRNNLAGVLVQAGRADEAVRVLRGVHSEAVANLNVGHFLYLEKNHAEATAYFRQAAMLDPSLVAARDMLDQLGGLASRNEQAPPYVADSSYGAGETNRYSNPYRPVNASDFADGESRFQYVSNSPQTPNEPEHGASQGARRLPPAW